MKAVKTSVAAALALALFPFGAVAQDAAVEEESSAISWGLTGVSDYVFRGVSQTSENPTAQATVTYTSPIGVYAGVWASGVDFGGGKPDFEVDYYVGYGFEVSDAIAFDFFLNRYTYPDAGDLNYNELITTTTFAETYSVTVAFSNDVWNSGEEGWYYGLSAEYGLPKDYSLGLNVGHSTFSEKIDATDYSDWGVHVSKSWGMLSASLGVVGTDGNGKDYFGEVADTRAVFTLSVGQ